MTAPRLPAAERHAHGTRNRYEYGCRCEPCCEAKRAYWRNAYRRWAAAQGVSNVDADQVRRHLQRLADAGLGARTVGDAAGIDRKTVQLIRAGRRARITRRTAMALLRVTPDLAADHALVDAAPTWALIAELREEGYTLHRLAKLLGYAGRTVPIDRERCSVRNAARVRALHEALTGEAARPMPRTRPYYAPNRVYCARGRAHAPQADRSHA